jgi:translation elongation factor P/translation initiation factor 5A
MKKLAEQLKNGDKIAIGPETLAIESIEISDVGKQGVKKCRIIASKQNGEKVILVRPSNYPFDTK